MSEVSEEVLSNADASYGGTTDAESVAETESYLPKADALPVAKINVVPPTIAAKQEKPRSEDLLKAVPNGGKTTKELIFEVADNVQSCRVCYDHYHQERNQARVLLCGHSFCTRCVVGCSQPSMFNHDTPFGVKCPECRKVSKQAPSTLPINFQFMQILSVLSLVKDPQAQDLDDNYQNFERLGQILPENELSKLTMEQLQEHSKAIFNAMRLKADKEKKDQPRPQVMNAIDLEVKKLDESERNIDKFVKNMQKLKRGEIVKDHFASVMALRTLMQVGDREPRPINNDWMREMVVYRPPVAPQQPAEPALDVDRIGVPQARPPVGAAALPIDANLEHLDVEIDALLEREAAAREEADPRRNLDVVRAAHLRRERESAQQREAQRLNEQLMRHLLEDRQPQMPDWEALRRRQLRVAFDRAPEPEEEVQEEEEEEEDDDDDDDDADSTDTDDSSFIEEPQEQPEHPRRHQEPHMTFGEITAIYRILDTLTPEQIRVASTPYPSGHRTQQELLNFLLPESRDPTEDATLLHIAQVRQYAIVRKSNADRLLRLLREFSVKYASNIVDSPRMVSRQRIRRQRPAPVDEYNALLTVIRKRAKEALRGNRPEQPANEEESNLTLRLIVNIANSMGVREELEGCLCPHRAQEEVFVRQVNTSTRQPTVFCTACRCSVPQGAQQTHAQGRRHIANVANRRNNHTHSTPSASR